MARKVDLTGQRFGRWTVLGRAEPNSQASMWKCQCDCGNIGVIRHSSLTTGNSKSCGCLGKEHRKAAKTTHGQFGTRLYNVWNKMKHRCTNPNDLKWKDYGGRGIKVCDEWQDFVAFYNWAIENGYDENAPYGKCTIDRIDVNEDYCPSNCRWADAKTQGNNKRAYHNQYTTKFA